ncbi:MAG: DUF4091 domain-containing protein [Bacteroidales bacterium]|nr:DUF4091 domain-containing protein [Bacteroidales bacterium]
MKKLVSTLAIGLTTLSSVAAQAWEEPRDTTVWNSADWTLVAQQPLTMSWTTSDIHHRQFKAPVDVALAADTVVTAWRGERLGVEALVVATQATPELSVRLAPWHTPAGAAAPEANAAFMRYVITNTFRACGEPPEGLPTYTVPDLIDLPEASAQLEAQSVRPIWVTVEVSREAPAGAYTTALELVEQGSGKVVASLPLRVNVLERQLPAPADYAFYLDLWQQPYAISRFEGVERWSPEHIEALRPYMEMLARAGQKTITAILFYEPWGVQSNDKFSPMVETILGKDGQWRYDYTILDRYIELCDEYGISDAIECFSMVPWDMTFRYLNEATGEYENLKTTTTTQEYADLWTSFLKSLAAHMQERGWLDRTMIAMDERGLSDMLNAYDIAQKAVPGLKMSLAGNYHPELIDDLQLYTLMIEDFFPADVLQRRKDAGQVSLMYTCCASPAPNQFSNSEPADNAYLPIYATATGFDGYLHWSFSNWTDEPLTDTRFKLFAPGDTYFIYPGGRSSIRYERMVEGIQLSEKLRILEAEALAAGDLQAYAALQQAMLPLRTGAMTKAIPTSQIVTALQRYANQ